MLHNSHLEAQVTPKNSQFQEGKISERRKAISQVTLEKSLKNYIPCLVFSPPEGYPRHPPLLCELLPHILHVVDGEVRVSCARFTHRNHSRGRRGEGGVICEMVPFVNGSSDQLQTQNEDSQYHSAPLLFKQDSP